MKLSGSRVWLTGASSGIGAALAEELGRRGARLALTARRVEPIEAQVAQHTGWVALPGDVTDRERMLAIGAEVNTTFEGIDFAILNAGTYREVTPDTFVADTFQMHLDTNIMGTVHGIEAVLPAMRARGAGTIVIVASVTGYAALPNASAYGSTKAYLISMADSLRADLDGSGVSVTVVCPGFVKTELTDQNTFKMPFLISAERAAQYIADGLEKDDPEIAFPPKMVALMKALRFAPGPLRRRFVARMSHRIRAK
jgi:short-subunit dehydrogenase